MDGTIAQQIALISYGNAYLSNGCVTPHFEIENSTFQFCNRVRFIEFKRRFLSSKYKEDVMAVDPYQWFSILKQGGCKMLRLYYKHSNENSLSPDYKLAGFVGGGGSWMIEAVHNKHSDFWANKWEVTRQEDPNKKIWSVDYAKIIANAKIQNSDLDLEVIRSQLANTLKDISSFAAKNNLDFWSDLFIKSLEELNSPTPNEGFYHTDLIVNDSYELAAQQLLFSAGNAWVFGGMGSWNDQWFESPEDNELYEKLSAQLYEFVCQAIVAATNSAKLYNTIKVIDLPN